MTTNISRWVAHFLCFFRDRSLLSASLSSQQAHGHTWYPLRGQGSAELSLWVDCCRPQVTVKSIYMDRLFLVKWSNMPTLTSLTEIRVRRPPLLLVAYFFFNGGNARRDRFCYISSLHPITFVVSVPTHTCEIRLGSWASCSKYLFSIHLQQEPCYFLDFFAARYLGPPMTTLSIAVEPFCFV